MFFCVELHAAHFNDKQEKKLITRQQSRMRNRNHKLVWWEHLNTVDK